MTLSVGDNPFTCGERESKHSPFEEHTNICRKIQNRMVARVSVAGRVQVYQNPHTSIDARLIEVSTEGFSLFLDYQLRHLQTYHVQLQVFRNATTYRVDVQAQCVYAALVRSEGFRHGFQFGPLDSVAEDALLAILA